MSETLPTQQIFQEFILAIKSGSFDHMKDILDAYSVHICNKLESQYRQPPLFFAAINTNPQLSYNMVRALVQGGANPNFKDFSEQTLLFYVCRDGKYQLAKYLIQIGCSLQDEDYYGQTPIFYAAGQNQHHLIDLFSDQMIDHVDRVAGQTPIFYAAKCGHLQFCRQLIKRGCDFTRVDFQNKTPVDFARKQKHQEVSEFLQAETKKKKQIAKKLQLEQEANNKKQISTVPPPPKNPYKLTIMRDDGSVHELTPEELQKICQEHPELETLLFDPDSIPLKTMQEELKNRWQKIASKILNKVWKVRGAYHFYQPVDTSENGLYDYKKIISKPMNLGLIKQKLSYNCYKGPEQFIVEMKLLWKNCYKYNGEDHQVSYCAKEMENTFLEAVKSYQFNEKFIHQENKKI